MLTSDKSKQSEAPNIAEVFDIQMQNHGTIQKEDNLNKVLNIIQSRY
jgi:hypothetical protein